MRRWRSLTRFSWVAWLMVQFWLYATVQSRCKGWLMRGAIAKLPLFWVVILLLASVLVALPTLTLARSQRFYRWLSTRLNVSFPPRYSKKRYVTVSN